MCLWGKKVEGGGLRSYLHLTIKLTVYIDLGGECHLRMTSGVIIVDRFRLKNYATHVTVSAPQKN